MFRKQEFADTSAQEVLLPLKGEFTFPASGNVDEVNDVLEKVLFSLKRYTDIPKYVFNRALYPKEDGVTLSSARFVVRPAASNKLEVAELKRTIVINAGENFFDKLIEELSAYFDLYNYYAKLQANVDELNAVVSNVIVENGLDLDIKFTVGRGLVDATDKTAVVGLSSDVIEDLSNLPLFDGIMESHVEGYTAKIADTLSQVTRAYEIVKIKSTFTKDLAIYSRKNLSKIIRNFVKRSSEHVRVGIGYIETETVFAVVEKVAVTEAELAELDITNAIVMDNVDISKREQEDGKTKIVTRYLISPFEKEDGEPAEVELTDLVTA